MSYNIVSTFDTTLYQRRAALKNLKNILINWNAGSKCVKHTYLSYRFQRRVFLFDSKPASSRACAQIYPGMYFVFLFTGDFFFNEFGSVIEFLMSLSSGDISTRLFFGISEIIFTWYRNEFKYANSDYKDSPRHVPVFI